LRSYTGGWPEYLRVRQERKDAGLLPAAAAPAPAVSARAEPAGQNGPVESAQPAERVEPRPRGPSKNRMRQQEQLERAVEHAEAALVALEDELAGPQAWATKYEAAKSEARHTAARRAVDEAYARLQEFEETGVPGR
jgi:ATP-binding cassette subfamily F protein 3